MLGCKSGGTKYDPGTSTCIQPATQWLHAGLPKLSSTFLNQSKRGGAQSEETGRPIVLAPSETGRLTRLARMPAWLKADVGSRLEMISLLPDNSEREPATIAATESAQQNISTKSIETQHDPSITMKESSVLIYGSGAVGSILGWRIAQHSQTRVSVVCRSNYDAVRRTGFTFQTMAWGDGHFMPFKVIRAGNLANQPRRSYDYVVCANKVTNESSASVIRDLGLVVDAHTTLVSAQNGMDVELPLRRAFPRNTILSAICNIGCSQAEPGLVQQRVGLNPKAFQIGIYGQSSRGSVLDRARRDTLLACDDRFGGIDDVSQHRWRKLIFNAVWNATSALSNLDTHQALSRPDTLHLAKRLAQEACMIAQLSGAGLDQDYAGTAITLAQQSGPITPSTLQDVRARRSLEIDAIWGFLIDRAADLGANVPVLALVYDALQQLNLAFQGELKLQARQKVQQAFAPQSMNNNSFARPARVVEHWLAEGAFANEELGRLAVTV